MPTALASVHAVPERLRRFPPLPRLLDSDLQDLFDRLNRVWFRGRLPRLEVRWSQRLKVAGQIERRRRRILLGLEYHCHYPADLESTLKHEMVHLLHWNHDRQFRRECARVGAAVHCRTYPGMFRPFRYLYQCPGCGQRYPARRILHAACARCGRGAYRPRYRLRLVEFLSSGR